jgi:hypothetical protein
MLLAALCLFLWNAALAIENNSAKNWPTVPGKVTGTEVSYNFFESARRTTEYQLRVRYSYTVGNSNYNGTTDFNFKSRSIANKKAEAYSAQSDVSVHYNSWFPSRSTIDPGGLMESYTKGMAFSGILFLVTFVARRRRR